MLATVACEAIVMLETQPEMVAQVRPTIFQRVDRLLFDWDSFTLKPLQHAIAFTCQLHPNISLQVREHTRTLWQQLDPRSEWVRCTSAPENPMLLLVLKDEVVAQRRWSRMEQEILLQDVVDEVATCPHLHLTWANEAVSCKRRSDLKTKRNSQEPNQAKRQRNA